VLGERVHHVAEEDRSVGARERVGELEVLFELPVCVLVVVGVVAPAERVDVAGHLREEVVISRQAVEVVAGLLERVVLVGELNSAIRMLDEEVLELHAELELVALLARLAELPTENRPRVVRPLLSFDVDVAREARESRLPWNRRVAAQVWHRCDVRVARELADLAGCEAGEAGSFLHERVEVLCRDELRARPRVHVDELREVKLDSSFLGAPADVFDARSCCRLCARGHRASSHGRRSGRRYRDGNAAPIVGSYNGSSAVMSSLTDPRAPPAA
jgi:hypothetical protein